MCIIEFVDFNEAYTLGVVPTAEAAKPKTRRSRKSAKNVDAVEEATVVDGEAKAAKKVPAKKAAAPKAANPAAPKNAVKTAAPKAAKKTNVGKKM